MPLIRVPMNYERKTSVRELDCDHSDMRNDF